MMGTVVGVQSVLVSGVPQNQNGREISRWIDFLLGLSKDQHTDIVGPLNVLTEYVQLSLRPVLANEL